MTGLLNGVAFVVLLGGVVLLCILALAAILALGNGQWLQAVAYGVPAVVLYVIGQTWAAHRNRP